MQTEKDRRNRIIWENMGKRVRVIVDRPIGYRHGDMIYPVNYGYIPGLIAGDGEDQDAYILGVSQPLEEFEGRVIGAIRRRDDVEDKLVVAPEGMEFHQGQIAEAVHFQEQFFDTTVDAVLRRSCGVIPYREKRGQREYLILLQTNNSWSFPKGHIDPGETPEQTALRELREETGLQATLIPGKQVVLNYDILPYTHKQVILFPGCVEGNLRLQETEIRAFRWVKLDRLREYLHADTCAACEDLLRSLENT